jgi:hypothetical protein
MPQASFDIASAYDRAVALAERALGKRKPAHMSFSKLASTVERKYERLKKLLAKEGVSVKDDPFEIAYTNEGWLIRDFAWAAIWNGISRPFFDVVSPADRGLFLPHCLTAAEGCARKKKGIYDVCAGCGRCTVASIVKEALARGYTRDHIYIVGGGSALIPIMERDGIKAIVGVSCYREARMYHSAFTRGEFKVPSQMALLIRWGCRGTSTIDKVILAAL